MQGGFRLRQSADPDDQHLKQDIRRLVEDLQDILKVQDTRWNQAGCIDTKKRSPVVLCDTKQGTG